jgi:regulator of sigma E protease
VAPASPAALAGLRTGDRILAIDGKAVESSEDVTRAISSRTPGQVVRIAFMRNGMQGEVAATLTTELDAFANPRGTVAPKPIVPILPSLPQDYDLEAPPGYERNPSDDMPYQS